MIHSSWHVEVTWPQLVAGGVQMRNPRGPEPVSIDLPDRQQSILGELVRSRRRPHDDVHRARIILQSAGGARNRQLAAV